MVQIDVLDLWEHQFEKISAWGPILKKSEYRFLISEYFPTRINFFWNSFATKILNQRISPCAPARCVGRKKSENDREKRSEKREKKRKRDDAIFQSRGWIMMASENAPQARFFVEFLNSSLSCKGTAPTLIKVHSSTLLHLTVKHWANRNCPIFDQSAQK